MPKDPARYLASGQLEEKAFSASALCRENMAEGACFRPKAVFCCAGRRRGGNSHHFGMTIDDKRHDQF